MNQVQEALVKPAKIKVLTVGHSTHSLDTFLSLIMPNGVTAIADVRSTPYSRFASQYNRERLKDWLKAWGLPYVFLGDELGARPKARECYVEGQALYAKIAEQSSFQTAIDRIITGTERFRVALLCTERDPLTCHRTILVGRALKAKGMGVSHILPNGSLETQADADLRLRKETRVDAPDLFHSLSDRTEQAYACRAQEIEAREPSDGAIPGHACHATGCLVPCEPEFLMCPEHWRFVPLKLRQDVWRHYRPGQCDDKQPSDAWLETARDAIASVAGRKMKAL